MVTSSGVTKGYLASAKRQRKQPKLSAPAGQAKKESFNSMLNIVGVNPFLPINLILL